MVIYSCCDIKSVDAEGCCNADKHIGFTGFSAEQCPGQDTGRQGHCANMFVCGIKSLCSGVAWRKHTDECTVTTCRAKISKSTKRRRLFLWLIRRLESVLSHSITS